MILFRVSNVPKVRVRLPATPRSFFVIKFIKKCLILTYIDEKVSLPCLPCLPNSGLFLNQSSSEIIQLPLSKFGNRNKFLSIQIHSSGCKNLRCCKTWSLWKLIFYKQNSQYWSSVLKKKYWHFRELLKILHVLKSINTL